MARILIIDDDERFRGMLRVALEDAGYDVIEAADGRLGLDVFRRERVDLVITDIIMPDTEGIQVICELRAEAPGVPIVAVSGGSPKGLGSYLPTALALGANRCLQKPFPRSVLLETVQEVLTEALEEGAR